MHDYTGNNFSHWNSNKKFKEKFGSHTSKTCNRLATIDSYTWNTTHNTESAVVRKPRPERWGSPWLKSTVKKRHVRRDNNNITILLLLLIIIIIII